MPNLVITNDCNLRCPFCFAREYRADLGGASMMTLEEFRREVDFAGVDAVRFCGGEPTLHPRFSEMLDFALARKQGRALLMTNGLWPEPVQRHVRSLARAARGRITYLVNVLEPALYGAAERARLEESLGVMDRDRVTLGFTLYKVDFDWQPFITLAERFGIRRLRHSIAAPTVTEPRSWTLEPDRDFPALAKLVVALTREARRRKLVLQSDCGYLPPCMFTEAELAELTRETAGVAPLEFRCHGPVDVGPGREAWRCYGLYSLVRAKVGEFESMRGVAAHFEEQERLFGDRFLFDACATCERFGTTCGGGCFAFRLVRALRTEAARWGVAIEDDLALAAAVPTLNDANLKLMEHDGRSILMLREPDGTWARLPLSPVETDLVAACDGRRTVGELSAAIGVEPPPALDTVARLIRQLVSQTALVLQPGRPLER